MFSKRTNLKIDFAMICLFTLQFSLVLAFSYGGLFNKQENLFLLFILMISMMLSYFTGLIPAVLYALAFDFIYASWQIYNNLMTGITISNDVYLWMLLMPTMCFLVAYSGRLIQKVQMENRTLRKLSSELITIDSITGFKTANVFFQDMGIFMNLSKRYNLDVSLMVLEFKYHTELLTIIGKEQFEVLVIEISDLLGGTTRFEDNKYVLNDYKKFAVLYVSDDKGSEILRQRIKERMLVLANEDTIFKKYKIELKVGIAKVKENYESPYELVEAAEKDMNYDL